MEYYLKRPNAQLKEGPFSDEDLRHSLENRQIGDDWHICWGDGNWMLAGDFLRIGHIASASKEARGIQHLPQSTADDSTPRFTAAGGRRDNDTSYEQSFPTKGSTREQHRDLELLQQLVSINQKQLDWIRVVGILALFSWFATQLYSCSHHP